jgi:AhpD family alkylhydroperoxidase
MKSRLNQTKSAPGVVQAMLGLEKYLDKCGLSEGLLNMVRLRASQLNACAYCIDMHTKDLRAGGESEQRIYELDAWRETPFYNERERAALEWTEAVTLLNDGHVSDGIYEQVQKQFNEKEIADLTLAIVAINGWNRMNVAFRTIPGGYQPGQIKTLLETTHA